METKQVIVIRKDLNMRRGKSEAQACHASMKVFFDLSKKIDIEGKRHMVTPLTNAMDKWSSGQFTKISLSCNSEEELIALYNEAKIKNIPCALVEDSGKTEFHGIKTKTCIAIGPDDVNIIDSITGTLKLR
jgi:PTH2 family peptidyl-tRNA hydrolase